MGLVPAGAAGAEGAAGAAGAGAGFDGVDGAAGAVAPEPERIESYFCLAMLRMLSIWAYPYRPGQAVFPTSRWAKMLGRSTA